MKEAKFEGELLQDISDNTIIEVNNEVPKQLNKVEKDDKQAFEDFKTLYKGVIDIKVQQETGNLEDKDVWEDIAKELFLKSKNYILDGEEYKAEPIEKKEESKKLNEDKEFDYQLLDRLKQDCKYFLGNGNGYEKHLWAGSIEDQISKMKEIYNSLKEKPEWLSMEDIDNYEKEMLAKRKEKESNKKEEAFNSNKKYVVFAIYGGNGTYHTERVAIVDDKDQAADKVAELNGQGLNASYEELEESDELNEAKDQYENIIVDAKKVQNKLMPKVIKELTKSLPDYNWNWRFEKDQIAIYDKDENFDFSLIDYNYELADDIVKNVFGKDAYIEAEIPTVGIIASVYVKDLISESNLNKLNEERVNRIPQQGDVYVNPKGYEIIVLKVDNDEITYEFAHNIWHHPLKNFMSFIQSNDYYYQRNKFEESQKQELADAKEALKDPNLKGDERAEYEHDVARLENKENLTEAHSITFTNEDVLDYLQDLKTIIAHNIGKSKKSISIELPTNGNLSKDQKTIQYIAQIGSYDCDLISLGEDISNDLKNIDSKIEDAKCIPSNTSKGSIYEITITCKEMFEEKLSDKERYQLRSYDNYQYGIYDQEEEKFIEKGSLKMMRAALKDIRNGNMPLEKENIKECDGVTQASNTAPGAKVSIFGEKEKKLNESIDENQYLENTFRNYKAYLSNNMIPLNIIQQNKMYYVYREGDLEKDQPGDYHYIYMADNKDQIEGWLYGIVQCVNHILDNK